MATDTLTAYMGGLRAGTFRRERGISSFEFDDVWANSHGRLQISAALPKSRLRHDGDPVQNFLWGLLPDNARTLTRWATQFGANAANPFSLLAHVGLDCAGGIQLTADQAPSITRDGGIESVTTTQVAQHLRALRKDSSSWILPTRHEGNFSLAGAQAKFALARIGEGWGVPWGNHASTHIVKPGVIGFDNSDVNEHLSLAAASRLGLNAAKSSIATFEEENVIVVERYDRVVVDGEVTRIHQEDLCQALGIHPEAKYQNEGGPSMIRLSGMLRDVMRGPAATSAVLSFLDANIYNWLIAGTDAHAKNYSILHTERGVQFAPLYDVASSLPYLKLAPRKVKLAMAVGGHYGIWEIDAASWQKQADVLGLDAAAVLDRIRALNTATPDAFSDANRALAIGDMDFRIGFVDAVASRSGNLTRMLNRSASPTTSDRTGSRQPRAGDLGATTNRGRFAGKANSKPEVELKP
jgi:serine/threonine-protein kinase HipA